MVNTYTGILHSHYKAHWRNMFNGVFFYFQNTNSPYFSAHHYFSKFLSLLYFKAKLDGIGKVTQNWFLTE